MNKEIQSYKKLLALITFIYLITLGGVILHYQIDSTPLYLTDLKKAYSSDEIRNLIKAMPEYQGDSLLINADKQLVSFDGLIQSFIVQVYVVPANIKYIKDAVKTTGLPEPYHVYKTAVGWYLQQHGNKKKNQIDSISVK
jgi:hypothetical protein